MCQHWEASKHGDLGMMSVEANDMPSKGERLPVEGRLKAILWELSLNAASGLWDVVVHWQRLIGDPMWTQIRGCLNQAMAPSADLLSFFPIHESRVAGLHMCQPARVTRIK